MRSPLKVITRISAQINALMNMTWNTPKSGFCTRMAFVMNNYAVSTTVCSKKKMKPFDGSSWRWFGLSGYGF